MDVLTPILILFGFCYLVLFATSLLKSHWWLRGPVRRKLSTDSGLLTKMDRFVCEIFLSHQNNPYSLLKMLFPAKVSLAFCPALLFVSPLLFEALWPELYPERPNINGGISSFLGVVGLICAVTYGHAFENAVQQYDPANEIIQLRVKSLFDMLDLCVSLPCSEENNKLELLKAIKEEQVGWMAEMAKWFRGQKRGHSIDFDKRVKIFLHKKEYDEQLSMALESIQEKVDCIQQCNAAACINLLRPSMGLIQWSLLILNGYIACFGIVFLTLESGEANMTFSLLFIFFIFLFLWLVSDMDDACHGFKCVDLKSNVDFICELNDKYATLSDQIRNAA